MSFSDITRWLFSDWTHAVAALGVLALGYALAWAAIRTSYERVVGRPMPRTRLVLLLDILADLADLAVNVPGALNRLLRSIGRDPLFLPSPPRAPAAPSGRSGEAGRATVATLALLALVGALGLADGGQRLAHRRHRRSGLHRAEHPVAQPPGSADMTGRFLA